MQIRKTVDASAAVSRTAVLVSADASFRRRLAEILTGMRWRVREASGGAEALGYLEETPSEALLLDFWLPDLEAGDFAEQIRIQYPKLDLICVNETEEMLGKPRSARRPELLHALRRAQEAGNSVRAMSEDIGPKALQPMAPHGIRSPQAHGINPAGSFVYTKPVRILPDSPESSELGDAPEAIPREPEDWQGVARVSLLFFFELSRGKNFEYFSQENIKCAYAGSMKGVSTRFLTMDARETVSLESELSRQIGQGAGGSQVKPQEQEPIVCL